VILGLLSACQDQKSDVIFNFPVTQELTLLVSSIIVKDIPRYYSATGYTNFARRIELSTSQSGNIKQLNVNEGDLVKAGELLIIIDESELLSSIKQARSAVLSAKINLTDRQEDINTATRLRESQLIPADQLRKAQVQLDLAQSQLTQAQSELKRQQERKPYYRITSPIDARVIKRWINQGDLAVTGKPLLQLEAIKGLEFETSLPARWLNKINIGDNYPLKLHDSDEVIDAKISQIIRSTNRITQTNLVKLSIPDSKSLVAGLSGQIKFIIDLQKQLLVPESSLVNRAGVSGVFVVDNNHKARFNAVKTERKWQQYRVVLSGLQQGDSVVLNPLTSLRDGFTINVLADTSK